MSGIFKDSKENRISNAIFYTITKLHFTYLLPDFNNIDEVYTNNLNIWFFKNSENKETKDGKGVEISNGILLNPDNVIFSKTKDGFELTEIDFINSELKLLEFLDFDKLNLIEQKQLKFYNDFLNKKKIQINWNLSDFLNHYKETKRFGFTIIKAYKKEDFEDLKERLDIYFIRFSFILKNLPSEDRTELVSDFKDQLLQLKNKQTITKFILKIDEYLDLIDKEIKNLNTINKYKKSFNPTLLKHILNFKNEDGTINEYHYLKLFNDFKNDLNKKLDKYTFESEYLPHLRNFNLGIENLLIEIIKHYKSVLNFESSKTQDFNTYNYRDSLNYNQSLSFLKSYSNILIYLKRQGKDINQLKNIQDYCIDILNQSLEALKTNFEIDVLNSPLKAELSNTKKTIKKAINKSDLKQPNLKTNATPQQTGIVKPDANFEFENNFDRVKSTEVYDFFKRKLVDKKYLTIDNLHNYLKVAFENPKQPPQIKFSFEKKYFIKDIRKIFYDYFTIINTEKYSTQDKYIKLLTDYFQGFDFEKIKNNFNK